MASIHRETRSGKVRYRLQFYDKDNRRRSIRLGRINKKDAEAICAKVERLVSASVSGTPLDNDTSRWVAALGDGLAEKLVRVGLISERRSATLGGFVDRYIEGRTDARPSTLANFRAVRNNLVRHFGDDRDLRSISAGDADDWQQRLVQAGYAQATIAKLVRRAKQLFRIVLRKGLVESNPFADLKAGSERNESRLEFVDRETIEQVIDAAPDAQWRLIIALARYGGIRTPSETLRLKWSDVDWEHNRFTVPSPKTERHGKAYRVVPLFAELRPYLEEAFDEAAERSEYVITRYRGSNANLRTQLLRIIRKAGVEPWARVFQNLRASRETELANQFPLHVVTGWLGNTPRVADRHYLQTLDEHFRQAVVGEGRESGATGGAMVVQKPVPQAAAYNRKDSHEESEAIENTEVMQPAAKQCDCVQSDQTPPVGLEPTTSRLTAGCSTN